MVSSFPQDLEKKHEDNVQMIHDLQTEVDRLLVQQDEGAYDTVGNAGKTATLPEFNRGHYDLPVRPGGIVETLSIHEVVQLLSELNLQQYKKTFEDEQIDGELLSGLDEDMCVKELGTPGHPNLYTPEILYFVGRSERHSPQVPSDRLVATPGKLLDFIDKGEISLNKLKYLILDEDYRHYTCLAPQRAGALLPVRHHTAGWRTSPGGRLQTAARGLAPQGQGRYSLSATIQLGGDRSARGLAPQGQGRYSLSATIQRGGGIPGDAGSASDATVGQRMVVSRSLHLV
uniref:SAM domain-containing protein n=1 Tax=Branchiostoma floridae TaxID=7739 RepID=C3YUE0_BRAFL|eukprot:XP_002600048.1 hypothetical protein BRAFLDRAFT_122423 [Branchiostoma floridae]